MPRFMLEGPRPCTIFCFAFTLCMSYVIKTFLLLVPLCFVQGQGLKREQKHTTKNFGEFHNHSPLLTMLERQRELRS